VSPLQQAEFHLSVARGLAAVYTLYAKTAGISINSFQKDLVSPRAVLQSAARMCSKVRTCREQHSTPASHFASFQERLQLYKKKVAKVAYDNELASAKRTLQLDVATANRFINAAMTDLVPEQREALRQVLPSAITTEEHPHAVFL
jgi:predicted YcjX-like family ATPase